MSAAPPPRAPAAARVVARTRRRPVRRTVQIRAAGVDAPAQARRYFATLIEFMEYKNNCSYPDDKSEFSFEELNSIKPDDLYKWMADKAFGKEDPGPDDLPQYARSTSLAYYKKAISYFMPNKGTAWTVTGENGEGYGNPTRSIQVNNLIKAVKRKETRGVGVKTSADRSFTRDEFIQAIDLLQGYPIDRLRHQAMMKFQNHLIARSDDTAHCKKECLKQNALFPEYLSFKMRWSKNVYEERDCPDQILLPCMNPKLCPVLGLAIFLEKWCAGSGRSSQWLFAEGTTGESDPMEDQDKEAMKCKNNYSRALAKVLKLEAFVRMITAGKLGTHSIRKLAATTCRSKGATKDEVDYRGRWKLKRMQDKYTDMQLDWPDIKAASKLCDGGVCLYRVKDGLPITDEWLADYICPNIKASFSAGVAAIIAKALVWACFEPSMADQVPGDIRNDVLTKIDRLALELEEEGENPIKKVEVIPSEEDGTISLDVVELEEGQEAQVDGEGNPIGAATAIGRLSTQWRAAIYAKVSSTAHKVTTMEQVQAAKFSALEKENKALKQMLRTLLVAPARIIHSGGTGTNRSSRSSQLPPLTVRHGEPAAGGPPATLHRNIQTLELLWDEYVNGIGGRKPARDFTDKERGRNKFGYCRRLGFWICMERLVRTGCTVPTAIDRIKRVYSGPDYNTMTKMLRAIKEDEKNGGHHELR